MSTDLIQTHLQAHPEFSELQGYLSEDEEDVLQTLQAPSFKLDMSNHVIIDNIPVIPRDKEAKLQAVLAKFTAQLGEGHEITIPFETDSDQSKGFCFLKCPSSEQAQVAIRALDQKKFTKTLVLAVYPYSDLQIVEEEARRRQEAQEQKEQTEQDEVLQQLDTLYQQAVDQPHDDRLCDGEFRDQYVARYGSKTQVFWSNIWSSDLDCVYDGTDHELDGRVWTYKNSTLWSPQGTFLLTYHDQGVKLWHKGRFQKYNAFPHQDVVSAQFSPCESYLLTKSRSAIHLWHVHSVEKAGQKPLLRTFPVLDQFCVNMRISAKVLSFPSKSEYEVLQTEEADPTVTPPSFAHIQNPTGQGLWVPMEEEEEDSDLWEDMQGCLFGSKLLLLNESEMAYFVFRCRENILWLSRHALSPHCPFVELDERTNVFYMLNDVSCPLDLVSKSDLATFQYELRERLRLEEEYHRNLCYAEEGRLSEREILKRRREKREKGKDSQGMSEEGLDTTSNKLHRFDASHKLIEFGQIIANSAHLTQEEEEGRDEGEGEEEEEEESKKKKKTSQWASQKNRHSMKPSHVHRFHIVDSENGEVFPFVPSVYLMAHQDQNEFQFSASGKYVSRLVLSTRHTHHAITSLMASAASSSSSSSSSVTVDKVYIYDCTNKGKMLDSRSLEFPHVFNVCWNPVYDLLAIYSIPSADVPAKISFFSMPSRTLLSTKNIFGVLQLKMKWSANGLKALVFLSRKVANAQQPLHALYVFSLSPESLSVPAMLSNLSVNLLEDEEEEEGKEEKEEEANTTSTSTSSSSNGTVEILFDALDLTDLPGGSRRLTFQDFEFENLILPNCSVSTHTEASKENEAVRLIGGGRNNNKNNRNNRNNKNNKNNNSKTITTLTDHEKVALLYKQGRMTYVHILNIKNTYTKTSSSSSSKKKLTPSSFYLQDYQLQSVRLSSMHPILRYKALTHMSFSPAGHTLCLLNISSADLRVEFVQTTNANEETGEHNFVPLTSQSQIGGKQFGWDPTGRIFTTVATSSQERKVAQDTGIQFWSLTGAPIHQLVSFPEGNLRYFAWRPKPAMFQYLAVNELMNKRSQLKKLEKSFTKSDRQRFMFKEQDDLSKKQRLVSDFFALLPDVWRNERNAQSSQRARGGHEGKEEEEEGGRQAFIVQRIVGVSSSVTSK